MTAILMFVGLIVLIVGFVITTQREFVRLDEMAQNAMAQIGVQVTSRWDALTQLAKATKSYSEHEHDTILEVINARRQEIKGSTAPAVVDNQEQYIEQVMTKISAVAESYPELKANTIYTETMTAINDYENKVRLSRMVFNDAVTKYNTLVKQIPSNFVASLLKYYPKEYLKEDAKKADMPELEFK